MEYAATVRESVCGSTWYSNVSNMLMLKTRPAAKGRRNMKAKLEPLSLSILGKKGKYTQTHTNHHRQKQYLFFLKKKSTQPNKLKRSKHNRSTSVSAGSERFAAFPQQVAVTVRLSGSPSPAWTEPVSSSPWLGTA